MNTNFTTFVSDVPVVVPVVPVEQLVATYTLYWDKMSKPPKEALQTNKGGNMSGKTDINPQWRLKVMTEVFGPVGFGWPYEIKRVWFEKGANEEVMCFAEVWFTVFAAPAASPLRRILRWRSRDLPSGVEPSKGSSRRSAAQSRSRRRNTPVLERPPGGGEVSPPLPPTERLRVPSAVRVHGSS